MKISYNWLKQYIDISSEYQDLGKILTSIGLEVEAAEPFQTIKGGMEGLVIGEVKTCAKHQNSDHLSLTTVDIGIDRLLQIVCGAPNVAAGQKVVVAPEGTILYKGDESFAIKKGKIRGELSEGMICAEDEIGLGTNHEGIMVLPADAKTGISAKEYFKIETDYVFEIGLTPNRIDGASHIGIARDLSAYFKQNGKVTPYKRESVDSFEVETKKNEIEVFIDNQEGCCRYSGVSVSGISVKESPEWLKNRLKAIGMKPINNVVDISNFVLHETGQPLHVFDVSKIKGHKIVVRTMPERTKFKTLDEVERELSGQDLMICNAEDGMCIAGVFGGIESGVTEQTTDVFIESANFNPAFIRRTSKRHLLNTDSSFRFERGADPNGTIYALKRAAILIKELAGGQISSDIVDVYPKPVADTRIDITYEYITRLIGKKIDQKTIKNILDSLDIKIVTESETSLTLDVPPYRVDVKQPADIVEDILRMYGYNNVEMSEKVVASLSYSEKPNVERLYNIISDYLSSVGFNEAMSNSLTKIAYYENLMSFKAENVVKLVNPLSSDLNGMRQTLLFGGLEAIQYNDNRKNQDIKLFEFGNCYYYHKEVTTDNKLHNYSEEKHVGLFITGSRQTVNWNTKEVKSDFYYLKSYVDSIFKRLGFNPDNFQVDEISNDIYKYGLSYSFDNRCFVTFGAVAKKLVKDFDIDQEVFMAELIWDYFLKYYKNEIKFKMPSKYPAVRRDLALLVDKNIKFGQIKEIAFKTEKKLLKDISIFDIYQGESLGADKKSYAVSFIIQDDEKTLTDQQIDKIMNNLIKNYEKQLNATIR
jgi:phenylalanyl-tRNA synthetase beta chain